MGLTDERSRSAQALASSNAETHVGREGAFLDGLATTEQQSQGLRAFKSLILPEWPAILVGIGDATIMKMESPILLLAILAFPISPEHVDMTLETQSELRKRAMVIFGAGAVGLENPSHDLIQSLLVAAYWHRPALDGNHTNPYQLVRTALELAIEIGLGGPSMLSSAPAWFSRLREPLSLEMKGTWLACYVASTLSEISARRPLSNRWTGWHWDCFQSLKNDSDSWTGPFLHCVAVTRVYETIATTLQLCNMSVCPDFMTDDEATHATLDSLKLSVQDLKTRLQSVQPVHQQLQFWHHVADIHINEPVLHTPSNKALFGAPYIALRIGVNDFACPVNITLKRAEAILALADACHAAIDMVFCMSPEKILSMPSLCFAPAVSYALSILVKAYVAVSAPGNTYGRVLSRGDLQLRHAMWKLKEVNAKLLGLDRGLASWNTRIVGSVEWLEIWLNDFEQIIRKYETDLDMPSVAESALGRANTNGDI